MAWNVAWNEYMDAFMFISRQFWVSREMNKWVFGGFSRQHKWSQTPVQRHKYRSVILGTFREKIWSGPEKSKNDLKKPKLKVIIHAFRLSWGPNSERHGKPPRDMEVIGNDSCDLERIYGCLYVHCEVILGFTRNEQMGYLEDFRGNTNGARQPWNVTSTVRLS